MSYSIYGYRTYPDGIVYVDKIKGDPHDSYRCSGCYKIWKWDAKKIGHKESTCRRNK